MAFQLSFRTRHKYTTQDGSPSLRVILSTGAHTVHCMARVDTGASYCLFQRELADALELDVESGHQIYLGTLTGSLPAFGHELILQTFDLAF